MTKLSWRLAWIGLCLLATQPAFAAIVAGDLPARAGETGGGVDYNFQMSLDVSAGASSETWRSTVGSRAWSDSVNLKGPLGIPLGWTMTSNWAYIKLLHDANVQISLTPDNSNLVPGFSLWSGVDNSGGNWHTYEQNMVPFWVDAAGFTYLNHTTTGPGPFANQVATMSLFLPAGEYTVAFGGNDNTTAGHQAAYAFTVSAAPVPLPSAVYLFASALLGLTGAARRKTSFNQALTA